MAGINIENGKWELHTMAAWSRSLRLIISISIECVWYYCQAVSFGPGCGEAANESIACRQDILIYYVRLSGESNNMEWHLHYARFDFAWVLYRLKTCTQQNHRYHPINSQLPNKQQSLVRRRLWQIILKLVRLVQKLGLHNRAHTIWLKC